MSILFLTDGTNVTVEPEDGVEFKLEQLQTMIGGNIEVLTIEESDGWHDTILVFDEDGKLKELPLNEQASKLAIDVLVEDVIVGPALLCRSNKRGQMIVLEPRINVADQCGHAMMSGKVTLYCLNDIHDDSVQHKYDDKELKRTATGLDVEHIQWGAAPLHIPDDDGGAYKTELVLSRSEERTEKINWWHGPDPRRKPHNHPWPFQATILAGGYTETRWTEVAGKWVSETKTYKQGDSNDMPANVYHTVDAVEPGTVTHMVCGALTAGPGDWGYLNAEGVVEKVESDPDFYGKLLALNPHKRK